MLHEGRQALAKLHIAVKDDINSEAFQIVRVSHYPIPVLLPCV